MPAYNAEKYIAQAIQSVLDQIYSDFELIVIDDGSEDNTAQIVRSFSDRRIVYEYQKNTGVSEARNRAIEIARGEYLAFLDTDDLFLPEKLAKQAEVLNASPDFGLVACGNYYIDSAGHNIAENKPWTSFPVLDTKTWLFNCPVWLQHILVRRSWVDKVGGFNPDMHHAEDYEWLLRLSAGGCQMGWVKDILFQYRLHQTNTFLQIERMNQGVLKALVDFYSRDDIPIDLRELKGKVMQEWELNTAIRYFAANNISKGREHLQNLLNSQDLISEKEMLGLAERIGLNTCSPFYQCSPYELLDKIWNDFIKNNSGNLRYKKRAKAAAARFLFFEAYHHKDHRNMFVNLFVLILNDLRILNRGMIVILMKSFFIG